MGDAQGTTSDARPRRGPRPLAVAVALYALVSAVLFATASPALFKDHTPYNHFALLADSWLHGRLDLGGPPPAYTGNNDFALFEGKHYVSFPPFPAVLLLPSVALAGSPEKVHDGLFFLGLAGLAPALLFLALDKLSALGRSRRSTNENIALALLFAFGTVYWFSAVQGTVWFAAHVVGAALGALFLWLSLGAERPVLAGLCLGLGFATRTPLGFASLFFLWEAFQVSRSADEPGKDLLRRLTLFALPAAGVLGLLLWHNAARFADPFEFGHGLLTVAWRTRIEKWGLFSTHYLGRNLSIVFAGLPFSGEGGSAFRVNGHGLALWLTSPFYVYALWPRRGGSTHLALGVTALVVLLPSLLYQNSGWLQFGYRFSNDVAPFLLAMVAVGGRRLSAPFWAAGLFAVVVNAFGALTFQRAGYERYYYVDRSQRILVEPD